MKKITLSILCMCIGFFAISAQAGGGKKKFDILSKALLQSKSQLRSESDLWGFKPDSSITRTPDGQAVIKGYFQYEGNKMTSTYYEWNEYSQQWEYPDKQETYYDDAHYPTLSIEYTQENGVWVNDYKTVWEYASPGNLTLEKSYNWYNNEWTLSDSSKVETTMNPGTPGTVASQIFYDYENLSWVPSSKYEFTYDDSGRELSNIRSDWDEDNNIWKLEDKVTSVYGPLGITNYYDEDWDAMTQTWRPDETNIFFNYDSAGNLSVGSIYGVNEQTGNWNMSQWELQATMYYDESSAGVNHISASDVNVWTSGKMIQIKGESELSTFRLYNTSGNLLYVKKLSGVSEFTYESQLSPGVYVICLDTTNGKVKVEKVTIK